MMKVQQFIDTLLSIANNYKTLYVNGTWGWPLTKKNKERACKTNQYNINHKSIIFAASEDTFGFDCCGLIKGVLWGWDGNLSAPYGGAGYACNGVPDLSEAGIINACSNVSTDFSNIKPGEAVHMNGHIGVYVGNGLAVEATAAWEGNVLISACNCDVPGYHRRNWTRHGFLPWVDYTEIPDGKTPVDITYQVYAAKHWMPNVVNKNNYAGVFNNPISGIYANASLGNLTLCSHQLKGDWLPEVVNRNDYAGNLGKPIDAFMVKSDITTAHYQAHTKEDGWLPPVTGYNTSDKDNGYAGMIGHEIDAIYIWADPFQEKEEETSTVTPTTPSTGQEEKPVEPPEEEPDFIICPLCGYHMDLEGNCLNPLCKNNPDYQEEDPLTQTCENCGSELDMRGQCMNPDCPCCPDYKEDTQVITTTPIRGDFNGDGQVTDKDATHLLYHTFYPDEYPLNQSGDVNGDGKEDDKDATHLMYHTFYPEEYPLHEEDKEVEKKDTENKLVTFIKKIFELIK